MIPRDNEEQGVITNIINSLSRTYQDGPDHVNANEFFNEGLLLRWWGVVEEVTHEADHMSSHQPKGGQTNLSGSPVRGLKGRRRKRGLINKWYMRAQCARRRTNLCLDRKATTGVCTGETCTAIPCGPKATVG